MADRIELAETEANFAHLGEEVNRAGMPITVLKNDSPGMAITPAERAAAEVAADFMDEYAEVFEELAK